MVNDSNAMDQTGINLSDKQIEQTGVSTTNDRIDQTGMSQSDKQIDQARKTSPKILQIGSQQRRPFKY
eukprot:Seg5943.3 transcript_id=Seg5943.3/GoldUCD/mRNA.D3Y31 product="hypothetical protein" protein_id=Seg5943.3/GoldUCD/D3Y31